MAKKIEFTRYHPVVLLVISDLEYSGAQRQVVELANNMDILGWEVYVCSLSNYVPLADFLRRKEERLKIIERRTRFDFTVVFRLAKLIRQIKAKIVHSFLFDAQIAARLAGLLSNDTIIVGSERNTDYIFKRKEIFFFKLTKYLNDYTIANSSAGARFNSRIMKEPFCKYRVVHNGVDVVRFKPNDSIAAKMKLGFDDQPIVGMFASFKPQKNHFYLLSAAQHVIKKIPNVRFLFVGDELYGGMSDSNEHKKKVMRFFNDKGLKNYCTFAGNKSDVENYYPVCSVTVLPSFFEGTPNVALESMACGVPVIATDVSDNALVIPDGKAGCIVPLGNPEKLANKICAILQDGSLRKRMSDQGRKWVVDNFSSQKLAEKTTIVYNELVNLNSRNRKYLKNNNVKISV